MSMHPKEIIRGITAVESILLDMVVLGKDAVLFVLEKDLWEEFMEFHYQKDMERLNKKKEETG